MQRENKIGMTVVVHEGMIAETRVDILNVMEVKSP